MQLRTPLMLVAVALTLATPARSANFAAYPKQVLAAARSRKPADRAFTKQLLAARGALAGQRKAARKQGIPLTPAELKLPTPPLDQNAAPDYVRLTHMLSRKPLELRAEEAAGRIGSSAVPLAEDAELARRLLSERAEEMALIRAAADKPQCVFERDRSGGLLLETPEQATMRRAARLVRAEAVLSARDGRHLDAVATLTRGFRIAEHAGGEPALSAYAAALAIEVLMLAGMEAVLNDVGPNAAVGEAVREAVAARRPRLSLKRMLEGEAAAWAVTLNQWRRTGPAGPAALLAVVERTNRGLVAGLGPVAPSRLSSAERKAWTGLMDAVEVDLLRRTRILHGSADKAYPARAAWYRKFEAAGRDRLEPFRRLLAPDLQRLDTLGARVAAQEECLIAGAALLAFRAQNGAFPELLKAIYPQIPSDRYSGRALRYRPEPNGFVVYSAGPDGKFSGGQPGPRRGIQQALFRFPAPPPR